VSDDKEKRIHRLEVLVKSLQRSHRTMYDRTYARMVRRQEEEKAALVKTRKWVKRLESHSGGLIRLGIMLKNLDAGKNLPYLTRQELCELRFLLERSRTVKTCLRRRSCKLAGAKVK